MQEQTVWKKAIRRYLFYTLGGSALLTVPRVLARPSRFVRAVISCFAMWIPALGAWLVTRRYPETSFCYGLKKCRRRYILIAVLLPLGYLGVSWAICFAQMPASFRAGFPALTAGQAAGLLGLLVLEFFRTMGEEFGWRGFLYPALEKLYGLPKSLLLGGLAWAVWHYPLILGGLYLDGTPLWWSLPVFTVEIFSLGVILTWLTEKSGSLIPAVIFHAAHNLTLLFLAVPVEKWSRTAYLFGEQGVVTVAITAGIAAFLLIFGWNSGPETTEISDKI
jgi:membrane protease YdiL (CAAX protease family)